MKGGRTERKAGGLGAKDVKRAVVLAAGLGTRLKPLTDRQPKPLLPVWGEPMIERIVAMLEDWGVEEIAVNAHHLADRVSAWAAGRGGRTKLRVSVEPEILGTGGVLNPLRDFVGAEPFWLVNGDIVVEDLDPEPLCAAFSASGDFASCWLSEAGPRTVEADPEGRICNWKSDDAGQSGTYTYCGVALLSAAIFDHLPPKGFATIVEAYERAAMEKGRFVVGSVQNGAFWWDAGTIERYRKVNDGPQPVAAYADPALSALVGRLGWADGNPGAEILSVRGSDRTFWRLDREGGETAIAIEYDDLARPENAFYAEHSRVLAAAGIRVPKLLADAPELKALALEDCNGGSLDEKARAPGADLFALYLPVVRELAKLHLAGTDAVLKSGCGLSPAFDAGLYAWERGLFEEHALKGRYAIGGGLGAEVRRELEEVAATLLRQRPVIVHRDFQSSNVLYRGDGSPVFIDYQGMRLGCAAYDLASLLFDPYVPMDEKTRGRLAREYAHAAPELADSVRLLPQAAVQRLVQALGAFGRLSGLGHAEFARHFLPALGNLLAAADEADLDAVGAMAEDLIAREQIRRGGFDGCGCGHRHGHGSGTEPGEGA